MVSVRTLLVERIRMKLVINDKVKNYFKKDREIRIDYVSVICNDMIVPIYYYNARQKGTWCYIDYDLTLDRIRDLNKEIIIQKIEELKSLGAEPHTLNLVNNLHTHPVGIINFSQTDYDGCLKPDYDIETTDVNGSNMLYSFNGDLYKTVSRTRKRGKNKCYKYENIEAIYLDSFEPHFEIDDSLFLKSKLSFSLFNYTNILDFK